MLQITLGRLFATTITAILIVPVFAVHSVYIKRRENLVATVSFANRTSREAVVRVLGLDVRLEFEQSVKGGECDAVLYAVSFEQVVRSAGEGEERRFTPVGSAQCCRPSPV